MDNNIYENKEMNMPGASGTEFAYCDPKTQKERAEKRHAENLKRAKELKAYCSEQYSNLNSWWSSSAPCSDLFKAALKTEASPSNPLDSIPTEHPINFTHPKASSKS